MVKQSTGFGVTSPLAILVKDLWGSYSPFAWRLFLPSSLPYSLVAGVEAGGYGRLREMDASGGLRERG